MRRNITRESRASAKDREEENRSGKAAMDLTIKAAAVVALNAMLLLPLFRCLLLTSIALTLLGAGPALLSTALDIELPLPFPT